MARWLDTGFMLDNRFRISEIIGYNETTSAYLGADLQKGGTWVLVWELLERFQIRQKPEGALHYLVENDLHYLCLLLEGQDLGMIYTAAGRLEECWAALWMSQVCHGIGQWHARAPIPTICTGVGDLRLSDFRITVTGRAILPGLDLLKQPARTTVPGQSMAFSSPEQAAGESPSTRSDVYALGAALYTLLTGTPPPAPHALMEGQTELIPPRKVWRKISSRLEKTVLKAMALDPIERYQSATQLCFELDRHVPRRLRRHRIGEF